MSHKKSTFWVYGISAALALMIIGILGSCEDVLVPDPSPGGAEARSLASVQVDMGDIEGEWYSNTYGETFNITDTTLTYSIASFGDVFEGDIVEVTDPTATEGYIYIQYTDALDPSWNGNFYPVKWSYLDTSVTPNTVRLSGCSDGEGQPTLAEAEDVYVINPSQDYFAGYSPCEKVSSTYVKGTPLSGGKPPLLLLLEQQAGITLEIE